MNLLERILKIEKALAVVRGSIESIERGVGVFRGAVDRLVSSSDEGFALLAKEIEDLKKRVADLEAKGAKP